jgi:hypothetical protein
MIPLTPMLLVAAANSLVGVSELGGDNRGPMVELFLREVGQEPGAPWCAAFVYHVGHASHYDAARKMSSWPLMRTASCMDLWKQARDFRILRFEPRVGDVFLKFSPTLNRFYHTGIVVALHQPDAQEDRGVFVCTTIEGNTNDDGSANGYTTLRRVRRFTPSPEEGDAFIRWVELEPMRRAA